MRSEPCRQRVTGALLASGFVEREPLAQEARDTFLVVVTDDLGRGCLHCVVGIRWRVSFVGGREHAEIVVTVAETDDAFEAQ